MSENKEKDLYEEIEDMTPEFKDELLSIILPNLDYEQFKIVLDTKVKLGRKLYRDLVKLYNEDWYKFIKEYDNVDWKNVYISILELESQGNLKELEKAFKGNRKSLKFIEDYEGFEFL